MDRNWLSKSRISPEYRIGIKSFLNFAKENSPNQEKLLCPCNRCFNCFLHTFDVVEEHLTCNGFFEGYNQWYCHGEKIPSPNHSPSINPTPSSQTSELGIRENQLDDMETLVQDVFGIHETCENDSFSDPPLDENSSAPLDEENEVRHVNLTKEEIRFRKLMEDAKIELYPGCKKFSRLSFIVRLFHIKCLNGWSSKSLTMLMELLSAAFHDSKLPTSAYETKKYMKSFDLGYEKNHACPNDCMLYWDDRIEQQSCHVCGASRWAANVDENGQVEDIVEVVKKRKPAKVLRYFPIIPRLKRLYMSSKTSSNMRWHSQSQRKDGKMCHPSHSLVWKSFDEQHKDFASDDHNVKFGIAADGVNPYRQMRSVYSTWPVVLIPYNLPPWLCMKSSSFILSMIIPGPKGPGYDIDVYLQPLLEELKKLWDGVETYDAASGETFKMRAILLWTLTDFPGYGMMSGQPTKGQFGCPCCGDKTCSWWLVHGKKFAYAGHRRWLEPDHTFRLQKHLFDGTEEHGAAPSPLSGAEVLKQLDGLTFTYGKGTQPKNKSSRKRKRKRGETNIIAEDGEDCPDPNEATLWKRKSIFFNLPYWHSILLRHNIDFMHTEKNAGVNVIGTVLGINGLSKDNLNARLDLAEMGIRRGLHPILQPDGSLKPPHACYLMSKEEKAIFCKVLKRLKLPDGYASNIANCVNLKEQ